jgi:GNAT superfamily N-acetyltransferase
MTLIIRRLDSSAALASLDLLEQVYLDAYAEPPYSYGAKHADAFRTQFEQQTTVPGFALVAAYDSDRLIGFAHGIPFPAGRWFRNATTDPPPDLLPRTKFAVIQFVVRRENQGHGAGRLLMTALLAQRTEELAILTSYRDVKARRIYEHWGWRKVGISHPPLLDEMDALALALNGADGILPIKGRDRRGMVSGESP